MTAMPCAPDAIVTCWNGAPNVRKSSGAKMPVGSLVTPSSSAATVATRMPHRMSPFTLNAMNAMIANTLTRVTQTAGVVKSPRATSVAGFATTILPSTRPMNVMNRPMPTPMARLRLSGIACMTASRSPVSTMSVMMMPSTKMTDMPICHGTFRPMMMLNATTALRPMPDASANGRLAKKPIARHMTPAPSVVAVASAGIQAAPAAP